MAQKRDLAPADPGARAPVDLQWLELMAYTQGCCLLHGEEAAVEAAADLEAPGAEDASPLH
jgi:hypothetical protein